MTNEEKKQLEEIKAKLPKREDYPRMLVSHNAIRWGDRIVLSIYDNNSCICVKDCDEVEFYKGYPFQVIKFKYCKPLTQPSTEPWTDRLKIIIGAISRRSLF